MAKGCYKNNNVTFHFDQKKMKITPRSQVHVYARQKKKEYKTHVTDIYSETVKVMGIVLSTHMV